MAGRRSTGADSVPPYDQLAEAYDIVHAGKPYAQEARLVRALVRKYARRPCRTLLDVACGSGRHLERFSRWFAVTGLDASPSMLSRARRRVPSARLTLGRMESFHLGRTFDVVTCLFSSIGYVRSGRDLRRTLVNLARHTSPGGVVVVEPWLRPQVFQVGLVHHLLAKAGGTTVLRMNGARRRRGRSVFEFHYLVGRNGTVRHFVERHDLGLFDDRTMRAAFRRAGLTVHHLSGGFASRRGLYVGVRPVPGRGPQARLPGGR
jgi:dTDP-3-amino-3,6-dideoxy-alpha-D-glucopyranose N,N-dimethyltransferase